MPDIYLWIIYTGAPGDQPLRTFSFFNHQGYAKLKIWFRVELAPQRIGL
jgi:hypothetical protein